MGNKPQGPDPREEMLAEFENDEATSRWTERQRRFAFAYLRHGNGARAVREAGYNVTMESSNKLAWQMLNSPSLSHIRAFIDEKLKIQRERLAISAEKIREHWAGVGFANMADLLTFHEDGTASLNLNEATESQLAAIQSIEIVERRIVGEDDDTPDEIVRTIKLKLHPKMQALDSMAKELKMLGPDTAVNVGFDLAERIAEAKRKLREERQEDGPSVERGTEG